jgi:hypothetical protein
MIQDSLSSVQPDKPASKNYPLLFRHVGRDPARLASALRECDARRRLDAMSWRASVRKDRPAEPPAEPAHADTARIAAARAALAAHADAPADSPADALAPADPVQQAQALLDVLYEQPHLALALGQIIRDAQGVAYVPDQP